MARRGQEARNIAKVAAGRKMLKAIFWVLHDGQARCLTAASAETAACSPSLRAGRGSGMIHHGAVEQVIGPTTLKL